MAADDAPEEVGSLPASLLMVIMRIGSGVPIDGNVIFYFTGRMIDFD